MWIGTANGLNRYDGSRVKVYTPYTKSAPGLPNEEIGGITEDSEGRLWIGTRTGLCYFDRHASRFIPVPLIRGRDTLRKPTIFLMHFDKRGRLWVASGKGVFVSRNGVMREISATYPDAADLDSFACDAQPAPKPADALYLRNDTELRYIDCTSGEYFSHTRNPRHWSILDSANYLVMDSGPDGRMWFSRKGGGLGWFDARSNKEHVVPEWKDKIAHTLAFDSKGRLWLCDGYHRAYVMEQEGVFQQIFHSAEDPYTIAYPYFHAVYEDPAHNLWFATLDGVSKLPAQPVLQSLITLPGRPGVKHLQDLLANSFVRADSTYFWVCRDREILLLDSRTYSFKRFAMPGCGDDCEQRFFDMQRLGDEWICGTSEGIVYFNAQTGRFRKAVRQPDGVSRALGVVWVRIDGAGNLWCACWKDAIYRLNKTTGTWEKMNEGTAPIKSWFGYTDKRGRLWVGYGNRGVRWFNEQTQSWVNPIEAYQQASETEKMMCISIAEDPRGAMWIATNRKGALKIEGDSHVTDSISFSDGLYTNRAGNIWIQSDGRIWLNTTEGLQHTLTTKKQLSGFALTTGLSVSDYSPPILQMGDRIFAGMNGKVAVIDLKALATNQAASPKPLLTGLQILGKDTVLPAPAEGLMLEYKQNFFSIEYSSPLHKESLSLSYAYKLEGFNSDWVAAGRNQIASFTAVPPGRYRFLVRTTNADGEWSQNIAELPVYIKAPFWMRWWAISLAVLILAGTGWIIYRAAERRRHRRQMEEAVQYFANSAHGHNSVNEICWDIARNAIAQMELEDCVVYLRDEQRPVLIQKAAFGPKSSGGFTIANPIEIAIGAGIVGAVAASGKPIVVQDTRKDPRYVVDDQSRRSELAVPIIHDGEVIGVIDSEHSKKNFYTEAHLKAFTTIASISSTKIAEAQAEAEVKEKAVQLLDIQKRLAESQLMALRAQMNPHFVFNCLNSIQECIVTAKYGEASLYLNKFAKLFRMLLNNSGRGMITLAEEIEVLELYLSLEHMRFEKSFSYDIDIDEDLEISEILIPSMLLQPFVENALWHGLMHKDGERKLQISFESIDDELYRCTIDDNGIGREKARQLKAAKNGSSAHQSRGMQITADRVDLMHRQGQAASIKILDKHDERGTPMGTTIVIELSAYLTATT